MAIDIARVKQVIRQNLKQIRTVEDLARHLDLPAETLRKDFRRFEKTPLSTYIAHEKLEKMKTALRETDAKCFDICFDLGYREDVGVKLFKRRTGMTMTQFRALYRTNKSFRALE